jgi:ABC-type microcin C transport system permease subunit YejB
MAETPNVMPSLHMPLQSGSDTILKSMKRSYRSKKFLGILDEVHGYRRHVACSRDEIVVKIVGAAGLLTTLVSGEVILSLTLGLPTLAPVLLVALQHQDTELAGSIILILSLLTVIGILLSDILLAIVDPRIRGSV